MEQETEQNTKHTHHIRFVTLYIKFDFGYNMQYSSWQYKKTQCQFLQLIMFTYLKWKCFSYFLKSTAFGLMRCGDNIHLFDVQN